MTAENGDGWVRREETYRGVSKRLVAEYLATLGGEYAGEDRVVGDGWRASFERETVQVGATLELNEVTVVFEGESAVLDTLVDAFGQKAMRAGG